MSLLTKENILKCQTTQEVFDLAEKTAVDNQFTMSYNAEFTGLCVLWQARNLVRHKGKLKQTRRAWKEIAVIITLVDNL